MQFKDQYITPNWNVLPHVKAFTTLKGLDFSFANNNRERLLASFLHDQNLSYDSNICIEQVHGIKVINADINHNVSIKAGANTNASSTEATQADAIFTTRKGTICAVLTADCLPILITNKNGDVAAAIHAGWRGLVNGIIENTIKEMNIKPADLVVWLGPCIGKEKFEIGLDVKEIFINNARDKNLVTNSIVPKVALKNDAKIDTIIASAESTDKYFADLHLLAKDRLFDLNVPDNQIYASTYCTHTDENKFYSYRRDKTTSRMISLIVLT